MTGLKNFGTAVITGTILLGTLLAGAAGPAEEAKPILSYDFTGPMVVKEGKFAQPVFTGAPIIAVPRQALELDGKIFFTVPGSAGVTLKNGGTLHAVVFFRETGVKGGENDSHDMIFFKLGDFLLGRSCDTLYFNMGDGRTKGTNWQTHSTVKGIPVKRWTALTAVVENRAADIYHVTLYIDGRKMSAKDFKAKINPPNAEPVTIGKGWGGPWLMTGMIATTLIFDKPLSDRQVAEIVRGESYLQKE